MELKFQDGKMRKMQMSVDIENVMAIRTLTNKDTFKGKGGNQDTRNCGTVKGTCYKEKNLNTELCLKKT